MAHADVAGCSGAGSCAPSGVANLVAVAYEPARDAVYYELVFSLNGETWRRLVGADFRGSLMNSVCGGGSPFVRPGERWCAELWAVGANGARAPPGMLACTDVLDCGDRCDHIDECARADFEPGPTGEVAPPPASGCQVASSAGMSCGLLLLVALALAVARRTRG
jgi:hypothetical protein